MKKLVRQISQSKRRSCYVTALAICATTVLLSGCATETRPTVSGLASGPACLDDSQRCINQRQTRLKRMQADPDRRWVYAREPRTHYATGVKLFAYTNALPQLTCQELVHGTNETTAAKSWLAGRTEPGLTSEQIIRARMLNDDVSARLRKTLNRKCHGRRVG